MPFRSTRKVASRDSPLFMFVLDFGTFDEETESSNESVLVERSMSESLAGLPGILAIHLSLQHKLNYNSMQLTNI